jgi:hypothetical protein
MHEPARIQIIHDGTDGYQFTISTDDGKVSGHVSVAIQSGHPDRRTPKQKLEAAKHRIRRLAETLNKAAWQEFSMA